MSTLSILGYLLLCAVAARFAWRKRQTLPLPPGPPADPLIGHLRIFPSTEARSEVFHRWSQEYGDVFSLQVPGKTIIVLGSEQAAINLLEKRSSIYSDRARIPFFDVVGWGDATAFVRYGPLHKLQRKLYHDAFAKNAISDYWSIQEREANILLKGLIHQPEEYDRHAQRFSGGIVTDLAYGHRIESMDDEFFVLAEKFGEAELAIGTPSLLDIHPMLRFLPPWVPGGWIIRVVKEMRPVMDKMMLGSYEKVQEEMKNGTARPSFTSKYLEAIYRGDSSPEQHRVLRLSAAVIFAAGYDTTWHSLKTFLACILLHPAVQTKAQEEIDRVVGRNRLPDFTDRDTLPYVQCVVYEAMRWQPVVPLGVPHEVMVDDTYRGMHIPKGSMVMASSRSITWDETKFHDPFLFKPERFLPQPEGAGEIFPEHAVFGWGRRICAGRNLAEASMWIASARILATLTISAVKDAKGQIIEPDIKFVDGFSRYAEPFLCNIHPRDDRARQLIEESHN